MELWNYRVSQYRVIDGDTIEATLDLGFNTFRKEKLRLARINAPEMKTTEGPLSKTRLSEILDNKTIHVQTMKDKEDRYGRYIAEVWIDNLNVNDTMVDCGFAQYVKY
jgi:micrococcal nuclease